jgi:hypothetical protein
VLAAAPRSRKNFHDLLIPFMHHCHGLRDCGSGYISLFFEVYIRYIRYIPPPLMPLHHYYLLHHDPKIGI